MKRSRGPIIFNDDEKPCIVKTFPSCIKMVFFILYGIFYIRDLEFYGVLGLPFDVCGMSFWGINIGGNTVEWKKFQNGSSPPKV